MDLRVFGSTRVVATAVFVLGAACSTATNPGGSGGHVQGGAGGKAGQIQTGGSTSGSGGQAGQPTTTGTGGNSSGGKGGVPSSTATGGSASGGKGGEGGNGTSPAAGGIGGGAGGQGGNTQTQIDAAPTGGTGGASTLGSGGSAGADASLDAPTVGHPSRVLLVDEGNRRVLLLNLGSSPSTVWNRQLNDPAKHGDSLRDIQLVGADRVAVSVAKGYVELDVKTGEIKKEVSTFDGVESLRRLSNGNTILGSNSNGGVTLQELDAQDAQVTSHRVTFTNYSQLRLFRRTPQDTFLIAVGAKLAEVNWDKQTLWDMSIPGGDWVFQGLRLPDKSIAVTSGYGATLLVIDAAAKKPLLTIGGKSQPEAATIVPNFYAGFQVLPNGHFVVTNWEGHGGGNGGKGIQLLEYDGAGTLVWKWKQDATLVSSLHYVVVLDGLDTTKLHDDVNGVLAPVTP